MIIVLCSHSEKARVPMWFAAFKKQVTGRFIQISDQEILWHKALFGVPVKFCYDMHFGKLQIAWLQLDFIEWMSLFKRTDRKVGRI